MSRRLSRQCRLNAYRRHAGSRLRLSRFVDAANGVGSRPHGLPTMLLYEPAQETLILCRLLSLGRVDLSAVGQVGAAIFAGGVAGVVVSAGQQHSTIA